VFLSCSSRDREIVRGIAEALTSAGLRVFFDEKSPEPGESLDTAIREQLDRATLFVAFISHATETTSHPFLWSQWSHAVERHRAEPGSPFILPVALDPIRPQTANVPDLLHEIEWFPLYGQRPTPELVALITERVQTRQRGAKAT
jgi:hypothetical protein